MNPISTFVIYFFNHRDNLFEDNIRGRDGCQSHMSDNDCVALANLIARLWRGHKAISLIDIDVLTKATLLLQDIDFDLAHDLVGIASLVSESDTCFNAADCNVSTNIKLSHVYYQLGEIEQAIQKAKDAIAVKDDNPYLYNHLEILLRTCGDLDGAKEAQKKASACSL